MIFIVRNLTIKHKVYLLNLPLHTTIISMDDYDETKCEKCEHYKWYMIGASDMVQCCELEECKFKEREE